MRYVIGIDEVGRGPLAGPVVVAAVLIPARLRLRKGKGRGALRDSKKLTALQRQAWNAYIAEHPGVRSAVALVRPKRIDSMNISRAANAAALRAFQLLTARHSIPAADCDIYLDGGLYLGNGRARQSGRTLVKADELIPAVSMASIVAKVFRDQLMVRLAKKHPGYGFERHKGYGTKSHRAAIQALGPSEVHRSTFLANIGKINI